VEFFSHLGGIPPLACRAISASAELLVLVGCKDVHIRCRIVDNGAWLRGGACVRPCRFHDIRRSDSDRCVVRRRPVLKPDGRPHRTSVSALRRHDAALRLRPCRRLPSQRLLLTVLQTSHHMEKTRPLYPRYITEIRFCTTQNNPLQYYGSRCHGNLLCSHTLGPYFLVGANMFDTTDVIVARVRRRQLILVIVTAAAYLPNTSC